MIRQVTHLVSIVLETIRPDEIKVVFEFLLGLVLFLLDLLQHRLEVHWIRDVWGAAVEVIVIVGGFERTDTYNHSNLGHPPGIRA